MKTKNTIMILLASLAGNVVSVQADSSDLQKIDAQIASLKDEMNSLRVALQGKERSLRQFEHKRQEVALRVEMDRIDRVLQANLGAIQEQRTYVDKAQREIERRQRVVNEAKNALESLKTRRLALLDESKLLDHAPTTVARSPERAPERKVAHRKKTARKTNPIAFLESSISAKERQWERERKKNPISAECKRIEKELSQLKTELGAVRQYGSQVDNGAI